jgi:hypothetical protein
VLWPQEKQVVAAPILGSTISELSNLNSQNLDARLGLAGANDNPSNQSAAGLPTKKITSRLNLSEYAVKNHVHRILRMTGTSDRIAILNLAGRITLSVSNPPIAS